MTARNAQAAIKAVTLKSHATLASLLFISCTLLTLSSVIHMWRHWFEICATLGSYRAAAILTAVTGAGLIVSWWVNVDND